MSNIIYKVVREFSAPSYHDIDTDKQLYDEYQASEQALWVVSYDTDASEIVEWLERFYVGEDDEARARAKELNEEHKNN